MQSNGISHTTRTYHAEIVAGSLLIPESRQIARHLLDQPDKTAWYQLIVVENILQKKSPATAKRQAKLIRNRLELMTPSFWKIIVSSSSDIVTQCLLAAAIKHSHLLGDYMDKVLGEHWRTFKRLLTQKDWNDYLEMCSQVDPVVTSWSTTTQIKLGQVVFRILSESKYIDSTRKLNMLPVSIIPEVKAYLMDNGEEYVLKCMKITQ